MLRGFDVSHYQGAVDWAALKSRYGITWGAAKATEAETGKDSRFPANWRGMKAAGLVRMAYNFAHPDNDPSDDALSFLAYIKASGGIEPTDIMVMDMEANQLNLPMLQVRDWLAGWADIVTRETGRKPFLYTGSGYIQNNATKDLRSHYAAWWFPRYTYSGGTSWPSSITGYPAVNNWGGAPDIWQFSQSFAGQNLDANVANMTLDDLKTRGTQSASKPPVAPPPEDDMPYTEAQLREMMQEENEEYGSRLWAQPTGTGTKFIADTKASLASLTAQVAGLTAAVKALAANNGYDPNVIITAVQDATKQALADLKITLSVDDTSGA